MSPTPDWTRLKAALFDMDGVLTQTARLHAAAWKRTFDDYLLHSLPGQPPQRPFDEAEDYRRFVDGKLREDGVASFLSSRGLHADPETIRSLAEKKDALFEQLLSQRGVDLYADGIAFYHAARRAQLKTAVVTASRHCRAVLAAARLSSAFDVVMDGVEIRRLHLNGKPDPAAYLEATRRLDVAAEHAIVLEDALAGVEAGRRGHFGMVIGVDRAGQADALRARGAHLVVTDLRSLLHDDLTFPIKQAV